MRVNSTTPAIVYLATNRKNGKRYIGITAGYLSQRISKHFWCAEKANSQIYFHRAIRKYGRKAFRFEVIASCKDYTEAKCEEVNLILELRPEYNLTKGGDGTVGWHPTLEQIERGAAKRRGRPGPWAGKGQPEAFRIGSHKWRVSPAGIASWKECSKLGPRSMARKVICLDDRKIYDHAKVAAAAYGVNAGVICSVCRRGRHKTAGGLVFRFADDPNLGSDDPEAIRNSVLVNRQRTAALARAARISR